MVRCLRPGLHDIGLLFMPDRFPESGTINALQYECSHEAWKSTHDTISCQKLSIYVYHIC